MRGGDLSRAILHLCVAASGFAGLVWQLVWVRQLGLAFGSTVHAVTLVTAVFLAGLGVGARLAGVRADRVTTPGGLARAYAACELAVATWGLLLVPVLAWLADAGFGGLAPDARGWMVPTVGTRLGQVGLAAVLLGPPTALMGASLPLLARPALGGRLDLAAWRLGLLAAVNTGGAAAGALLTDLVLVPLFGMRGTCGVAALAGVVAGLGALAATYTDRGGVLLGAGGLRPPATPPLHGSGAGVLVDPERAHAAASLTTSSGLDPSAAAAAPAAARSTAAPPATAVAAALALAGFAAMGLEVVWFRFLGSALGPYRAVFSLLVGVLLVGWLLGALLAGGLARRWGAVGLFTAAQAAVATFALLGLAQHDPRALLVHQLALAETGASTAARLGVDVRVVLAVVLPAAIAMGASFPLGNALVQRAEATVGRNVGRLWLATTLGNAGGALLTGLWLLPALGMQGAALLLAALAALAPVALAWPDNGVGVAATVEGDAPAPAGWTGARFAALGLTSVGLVPVALLAVLLPTDHVLWASFPHGRVRHEGVLAVDEGLDETIVVTGHPDGPARLWTNGHPMSSTAPTAQRYMRLLAHLPLLAQEAPERVLVICFGVGNTLHAASLHPSVTRLDLADLSAGVLAQAPLFAHANRGVLGDPRVRVHLDDGRHVLRTMPVGTYDVITLEPPPIAHAGVASLYTREFYALARSRLVAGGWVTQWLPAYQVPEDTVRALVRAFVDVFPDAVLLVGDGKELILAGVRDGVPRLDAAVARRMAAPAMAQDLASIGVMDVRDLAATFAAGGAHLRAATAGTPPMVDDHPVAEWSQVSHVARTRLPDDLFAPGEWGQFAPVLAGDADMAARMEVNAREWATEGYLSYTNLPE